MGGDGRRHVTDGGVIDVDERNKKTAPSPRLLLFFSIDLDQAVSADSIFLTTNENPGLSGFFGSGVSRGFGFGCGFTTGGVPFGGGFFGSSFCAEMARESPKTIANVNKIFCITLMALFFLFR